MLWNKDAWNESNHPRGTKPLPGYIQQALDLVAAPKGVPTADLHKAWRILLAQGLERVIPKKGRRP